MNSAIIIILLCCFQALAVHPGDSTLSSQITDIDHFACPRPNGKFAIGVNCSAFYYVCRENVPCLTYCPFGQFDPVMEKCGADYMQCVLEWCPQVPAGQTSLAPYEPGRICSTKFFRCYDDGTAYLQACRVKGTIFDPVENDIVGLNSTFCDQDESKYEYLFDSCPDPIPPTQ